MFVWHIFHTASSFKVHTEPFKIKTGSVIRLMKGHFSWMTDKFWGFLPKTQDKGKSIILSSQVHRKTGLVGLHVVIYSEWKALKHSPVLAGRQRLHRPYVTLFVPPDSSLLFFLFLPFAPPNSSLFSAVAIVTSLNYRCKHDTADF